MNAEHRIKRGSEGGRRAPVIVYCVFGKAHLTYAIWSITSLRVFGYDTIEIVVANDGERRLFARHWPDIPCSVIQVNLGSYPAFSYKPFALAGYLEQIGIQHKGRDIVICDADIIWKQGPSTLFHRFEGRNWVHKITAMNPRDFDTPLEQVKPSNIGLRTMLNFAKRYDVELWPNFNVNAGLFMLPETIFPEMLARWLGKITALPGSEMLMSEALMALTYAEMGLAPVSDRADIKHLGVEQVETDRKIFSFRIASPLSPGQYTGYDAAKHYFGDQRPQMHVDAVTMGLDTHNLLPLLEQEMRAKTLRRLKTLPKRALAKLLRI